MTHPSFPHHQFELKRAPWAVAALVWLAGICVASIVPLAELQVLGFSHFESPAGVKQLHELIRDSLFFPGPLLPLLLLWKPRWSVIVCVLLLCGYGVVAGISLFHMKQLGAFPAISAITIAPAVLVGLATFLAYRRRDWSLSGRAMRPHEI